MSIRAFSRWITLACVALPTAAVVIARAVLPSAGPRGAAANVATTRGDRADKNNTPLPRELRDNAKLISEIERLRDTPPAESPFVSRIPRALTKIVMTTQEAAPKPLPEFTLTSIAGGAKQSFAIINGRVQRLGDDLGDGWTVSAIDAGAGEVQVSGPDETTITLALRKDR